jgi:hypothetical protein
MERTGDRYPQKTIERSDNRDPLKYPGRSGTGSEQSSNGNNLYNAHKEDPAKERNWHVAKIVHIE